MARRVASLRSSPALKLTRRRFLAGSLAGAAGLALYSGEIERHWIEVTHHEIRLSNLPLPFDGFHIAQLSDIHMDQFSEPFFVRRAVEKINRLKPDAVFLTGDFVTHEYLPIKYSLPAAWSCAHILEGLECSQRYGVLGNHDMTVGAELVTTALSNSGITILRNASTSIDRGGSRIWLAV